MKILQIHSDDGFSQAAGGHIAMSRLHLGLKKAGVDSKILCGRKTPGIDDSTEIRRSKFVRMSEALIQYGVTGRLGFNNIQCISSFGIKKNPAYLATDLLHFQGMHGDFFSYLALPSLTANKPTVYTLHDMWSYTGHCAYSYDCDRWKRGCGKCPYPDSHPAIKRDSTSLEWKLKHWIYDRANLTIICVSNWLTEQVKQSMLNRFPIHTIPNGIDTEVFRPLDTAHCRSTLGIPPAKNVLMFAAVDLNDRRKGADLLSQALQRLPKSVQANTVLLTFGYGNGTITEGSNIPTINLGYVGGDRLKAIAYSAADVFVCPTRAESQGLVLLESMACGTPVVSFNVGGVPDAVRPDTTGYLAEPENQQELCDGIVHLLEDERLRHDMGQNCRRIALKEFSLDLHVKRHIDLYRQVLRNGTG